jgi:glycosyltransferase involved in cell wall biosynthesis
MKIAMFTSTFPPYRGGMGNVAFNEALALAGAGHSVTVVTPLYSTSASLTGHDGQLPFTVHRLKPLAASGNGGFCAGAPAEIANADAVCLHYPFFGTAELLWLDRLFGIRQGRRPRFVIRYDMDVIGHGIKRLLFAFHTGLIMPAIIRSADATVFSSFDYASSSNAAWYLREAPDKCVEIPYGVDRRVFYPDKTALKRGDRLLFVGGLDHAHYFKGLERLLRAIAALRGKGKAVALHVVGNGDMEEHYRDICRQLHIEQNVTFLTQCDNDHLRREYSEASATILPSRDRSESFGLVLIESMACGTALIASDLPGVRTLVQHGATGYLFAAEDAAPADCPHPSLVAAIGNLLDNPDRAAGMGRNGLELVTAKYDWQTIGTRLAEVMAG